MSLIFGWASPRNIPTGREDLGILFDFSSIYLYLISLYAVSTVLNSLFERNCILLFCSNSSSSIQILIFYFPFNTGLVFIMYLSPTILLLAGIANSTSVELSKQIKNEVGLTPTMGFNNWNSNLRKFTCVYLGFASSLNPISILSSHSSSSNKSVREPWTQRCWV
jgi:hypothetical protein